MLGGGDHAPFTEEVVSTLAALQAFDQRRAHGGDEAGVFGIAFIGPPPAIVLRDGDRGGEIPVDPGDFDLDRGGVADATHQVGIARRAEADIVGKDGRADDIGVSVDGIGAPDRRDRGLAIRQGGGRCVPHFVGEAQPLAGGCEFLAIGATIAAVQIAAPAILAHFLRGDRIDLRLDQLGDLVFQRHARNEVRDLRFASQPLGRDGRFARGGDGGAACQRYRPRHRQC